MKARATSNEEDWEDDEPLEVLTGTIQVGDPWEPIEPSGNPIGFGRG
jgi:hypothetical protein